MSTESESLSLPELADGYYWHIKGSLFGDEISLRRKITLGRWQVGRVVVDTMIPMDSEDPIALLEWGARRIVERHALRVRDEQVRQTIPYGRVDGGAS